MKTKTNILVAILITTTILITSSTAKNQLKEEVIKKTIEKVNFNKAIEDVCKNKKHLCKILKDKRINSYLKEHYKKALYSIAYSESSFKYKYGKIDKNDRGFYQINIKTWSPQKIKKILGIKTTIWSLTHNLKVQTEVALRIWLYNTAIYIYRTKNYPKNLPEYISLYHKPSYISKPYARKVRKVVYKINF